MKDLRVLLNMVYIIQQVKISLQVKLFNKNVILV